MIITQPTKLVSFKYNGLETKGILIGYSVFKIGKTSKTSDVRSVILHESDLDDHDYAVSLKMQNDIYKIEDIDASSLDSYLRNLYEFYCIEKNDLDCLSDAIENIEYEFNGENIAKINADSEIKDDVVYKIDSVYVSYIQHVIPSLETV